MWSRYSSSPVRVETKRTLPKQEVMAIVFWDGLGILLVNFMWYGTRINSISHCNALRKLCQGIKNKRRCRFQTLCFTTSKDLLMGKRFDTDDEVKTTVNYWLSSQKAEFYNIKTLGDWGVLK
ncbi:hypothetical protein Trydic_g17667 [Trypoxylus dichotomus]